MDIPATLAFITTLILVGAFIARPFLAPQKDEQEQPTAHPSASALRKRADLLAKRNQIYSALRELDFDHQTNKIADDEYAAQRQSLVAEGVGILQELDATPTDNTFEAAILARPDEAAPASGDVALYCPKCGAKTKANDAFCGRCGAKLSSNQ